MKAEIVTVVSQQILFARVKNGQVCLAVYDPFLHHGKISTLGRIVAPPPEALDKPD